MTEEDRMKPTLLINGHDYTEHLSEQGLKITRNDLDADGSGRNLLDGLMYRSRIATKIKIAVAFNRIGAATLAQIESDMDADYVNVTFLDAKTNSTTTSSFYCSTINEGVQRCIGGEACYDGVTFNLTER